MRLVLTSVASNHYHTIRTGGVVMKKILNACLMGGVFMVVLGGGVVPLLNFDTTTEAYAMGRLPPGDNNVGRNSGGGYQVPEPATLSLLGLGIAGAGIFYALKRRK